MLTSNKNSDTISDTIFIEKSSIEKKADVATTKTYHPGWYETVYQSLRNYIDDNVLLENERMFTRYSVQASRALGTGVGYYTANILLPYWASNIAKASTMAVANGMLTSIPLLGGGIQSITQNCGIAKKAYESILLKPLAERVGYYAYGSSMSMTDKAITTLGQGGYTVQSALAYGCACIFGRSTYYTIKGAEYIASKTFNGGKYVMSIAKDKINQQWSETISTKSSADMPWVNKTQNDTASRNGISL